MTDYDILLSLLDMYRSELEKRKNGVQFEYYDFQTGKKGANLAYQATRHGSTGFALRLPP